MGGVEGGPLERGAPRPLAGMAEGFDLRMERHVCVLTGSFEAFPKDLTVLDDERAARMFAPVAGTAGQFQATGHEVFVGMHT